MSNELDDRDSERADWEGFNPQDLTEQERRFLLRVKEDFLKDDTCCHLEDTASEIMGGFNKDERKDCQGIKDNLSAYFEILLGPEEWEKLQDMESKRILDFDKHAGEGVG